MMGKTKALNLLLREIIPGGHDVKLDAKPLYGARGGFTHKYYHDKQKTKRIDMAWVGRAIQAGGVRHGHAFYAVRKQIKGPGVRCYGWEHVPCKAACIIEHNEHVERAIKAISDKEKFKRLVKLLSNGEVQAALMLLRLL